MASTRKRTKTVSYVYDDLESELASDYESTSKRPAKRKKTKKGSAQHDSKYEDTHYVELGKSAAHPVSLHAVEHPIDIRRSLLDWYSGVHENRGMPWRKSYDPSLDAQGHSQRAYEVWISEIMLQQTQVATVIPYYNRWIEKFPTIRDLANSDIETVNALWKGLGYYSRAARLLSGAQKIVNEYGGLFPDNAKDMMANVPGIGRYSAGAISSIAYNHCEPVLDGNVNRLLSRVLALHANPKNKATLDVLWDAATAMVKESDEPGNINQALIELGATVCKPRDPDCSGCPIKDYCAAYRESRGQLKEENDIEELCTLCEPVQPDEDTGVTRYPMKVERKKAREEVDVVNVVEWLSPLGSRLFLLVRRPEKGLLAGLHEFPTRADVQNVDTPEQLRMIGQDVLRDVLAAPPPLYHPSTSLNTPDQDETILRITKIKPAGDVLHVFSHIRKTYRVQWILLEGASPNATDPEKPPALKVDHAFAAISTPDEARPKEAKNGKAEKAKGGRTTSKPQSASKANESNLRWVEFDGVKDANIGTGVMKVWKKVNDLWANKSAAERFFQKRR
ncbi:hypothetical protein ACEPAH_4310 [Sanghuangporus vaninii]